MNTKTLVALGIATLALVAVPSASAEVEASPEAPAAQATEPTIPCIARVGDVEVRVLGQEVILRDVSVGDC